jgi:uncharacterized protein YyaL (SSP411 family)
MPNRLSDQTSPYLLQHKDNPVDWYPWGEEALERARREDKPILLSIGYAACHWCHVMEDESFEDEITADQMNESFVCIKVDREERPDLDAIYMEAVQAMTGHGGWPMTVFLTPEGVPFYGGTYFPAEDRHGLPSFKKILAAVADAWRTERDSLESQGKRLTEFISTHAQLEPSNEAITEDGLKLAFENLTSAFDPEWGGFGNAPKFPQPMTIDLCLRLARRGYANAAQIATRTLDAMAAGGIFDQLRGGFHRYSVDRFWLVPHFEKMLYDNASLLRTYARSYQEAGKARHLSVAEATADWMLADMRDADGGFYSAMDADSEGREGAFYVWSLDEVREILGGDAVVATDHWGISEEGNFEGDNILVFAREPRDTDAIERARKVLLEHRATRAPPETDTKVLASWTGLAAAALAEAGAALDRPEWVDAAAIAARFVLSRMVVDGRLMRSFRNDRVGHLGYAEDYAFMLEACLALFEATFDPTWLQSATELADKAIDLFHDPVAGGFYVTGTDAEPLITRPKDLVDNAIPSANSVMALELQRLALFTMNSQYESVAVSCIRILKDASTRSPQGFAHLLAAVDFYTSSPAEVVIIGEPGEPETDRLLTTARSRFSPNKVLVAHADPSEFETATPLLAGKKRIDGRPAAYVCHHGRCEAPVTEADALAAQLGIQ